MKQFDLLQKLRSRKISNDSLLKKFQKYVGAKKQIGIIYLHQDNMPCIIPDTKHIAAIPNAWNKITIPFKSEYHPIPDPLLQEKLFVPGQPSK